MKTGIFGGTFDPIHMGHLILAETIRSDYDLDRILFMPASVPPHKTRQKITNPEMRLKMVNLGIARFSDFIVSDFEIFKGGLSFTRDTIRYLHSAEEWKNDSFYLIIGSDNLAELNTWKEPEFVCKEIHIMVMPRAGFDVKSAEARFLKETTIVKTPIIEISSTEIRERVRKGKSIRFWVPESVENYIVQKGLYL